MALTSPLLSHSDGRLLPQHLQEVMNGVQQLLQDHTTITQQWIGKSAQDAARLHDIGKATREFQEYIKAPSEYNQVNPSRSKTHANISALLALSLLQRPDPETEPWAFQKWYRTSWAIASHHTGLQNYLTFHETLLTALKESAIRERIFQGRWEHFPDVRNIIERWSNIQESLECEIRNHQLNPISESRPETPTFGRTLETEWTQGRLWLQAIFSLLLEADRLHLATKQTNLFLTAPKPPTWNPSTITQTFRTQKSPLQQQRTELQNILHANLLAHPKEPIYTLRVPTGLGKTALSALWALTLQSNDPEPIQRIRPIIIALPYLSLIDQTADVWMGWERRAREQQISTKNPKSTKIDLPWVATYSSTSSRELPEKPNRNFTNNLAADSKIEENDWPFYIDTWYSPVTVTTYDQLLLTLFDPHPTHQLRFHKLLDAYLICDEVQSIPAEIWKPFQLAIRGITKYTRTRALMMSATLPESLFPEARSLVPQDCSAIQINTSRYHLTWELDPKNLATWIEELSQKIRESIQNTVSPPPRIAITVNQRKTAKTILRALQPIADALKVPLYLISADVSPRDRRLTIAKIKDHQGNDTISPTPCIAITTQTIEAGVDLDFTQIFRDFAPWDRLIQIAGRSNREHRLSHPAPVEVVNLLKSNALTPITETVHSDSEQVSQTTISTSPTTQARQIYPATECDITERILRKASQPITESDVANLSEKYFATLQEQKNTGRDLATKWYIEEERWNEDISYYLRGQNKQQIEYPFIDWDSLTSQEQQHVLKLINNLASQDRWKRRETLRVLNTLLRDVSVAIRKPKTEHLSSIGENLSTKISTITNKKDADQWRVFFSHRYIRTTREKPATGFQYEEETSPIFD